jgi:hypothetical protein
LCHKRGALAGMVVISAGNGVSESSKRTLAKLARASGGGKLIDAGDDAAIPGAFGRAAAIMCSTLDAELF